MLIKNKKLNIAYEVSIILLAVVSIVILVLDYNNKSNVYLSYIDNAILGIFAIDYFTRLIISKDKKTFIKNNIIDLISIIPVNSIFTSLRILRITRLAKLLKLSKLSRLITMIAKLANKTEPFIKTNNLHYVLYLTLITMLLGTISISLVEKLSFSDSLWWCFVTITTVGYGDISPKSGVGKIIASILMIVGIGFISMLSGTVATYFLSKNHKNVGNKSKSIDLSHLDDIQIEKVYEYVDMISNYKKGS